jgi:hypothetical protein
MSQDWRPRGLQCLLSFFVLFLKWSRVKGVVGEMCIDMLEKNLEEALEAVWLTGSNRLLRRHGEGRREPELRIAHAAIIAAGRRLGSFWDPGAHAENTGVEPETAAEIQGNPKGEKKEFCCCPTWLDGCMHVLRSNLQKDLVDCSFFEARHLQSIGFHPVARMKGFCHLSHELRFIEVYRSCPLSCAWLRMPVFTWSTCHSPRSAPHGRSCDSC